MGYFCSSRSILTIQVCLQLHSARTWTVGEVLSWIAGCLCNSTGMPWHFEQRMSSTGSIMAFNLTDLKLNLTVRTIGSFAARTTASSFLRLSEIHNFSLTEGERGSRWLYFMVGTFCKQCSPI
jgi:hypothetical protein